MLATFCIVDVECKPPLFRWNFVIKDKVYARLKMPKISDRNQPRDIISNKNVTQNVL